METRKNTKKRIVPALVFGGGMLIYLLALLPFLISHKGLFFYYGDYNVQQVPFLIFAHRAVRQGRFFWNPLVDLGGNMAGTFAFYLWGSPFFWLTIPFPESWLPYMMTFLMALKCGTASVAAYAWIRTQTRSEGAAVLGAYLYAFSGFQACNLVFQHFHDVTAFFPLYLLAFDRFVEGRKKGKGLYGFPLMTALMSVINYYFFFGQVLFLILYYLIRWGFGRFRSEGPLSALKEVLTLLAGGGAGLLLSAFFLVQSVGGIMGNSRVSEFLSGYDLVVYPDSTTPLAILKSFFMVPDLIARGTVFTSDHIRNGSLAFYLPCFAMAGVFAYWSLRLREWKKRLAAVLAFMAFVPVLCAAFSAFNDNFYVRWFYMPVLLCACMTAEALEENECAAFTRGAGLSLLATACFLLMCYLPVYEYGEWSFTSIGENRKLLKNEIQATLLCSLALIFIIMIKRRFRDLFGVSQGACRQRSAGVLTEGKEEAAAEVSWEAAETSGEAAGVSWEAAEAGSGEASPSSQAGEAEEKAAADPGPGLKEKEIREKEGEPGGMVSFLPAALCLALTVVCCMLSTSAVADNGSSLISYTGFEKWKAQMLSSRPVLEAVPSAGTGEGREDGFDGSQAPEDCAILDDSLPMDAFVPRPFARVETDSTSTNYEMVWGIPTIHCFESTVHPSIFQWYRGIGMIRTVESTLPFERIGARALMSVRYYLENDLVHSDNSYTDKGGIEGYSLINSENGYKVYETENYIPMGVSFDSYITEDAYDAVEKGRVSDRILVKDIILSDEMAEKYGGLMTEDMDPDFEELSYSEFSDLCRHRAASACRDFAFDKNGFHALAHMEKENLVLFSVPYDRGFTAFVDGEPAEVECVDYGLTAVCVPEGDHEIRFRYRPVGLGTAASVSGLTALALLADLLRRYLRRGSEDIAASVQRPSERDGEGR